MAAGTDYPEQWSKRPIKENLRTIKLPGASGPRNVRTMNVLGGGGGGGGGTDIARVQVSVDNNTGVPSATGSVTGDTLILDFHNLKGEKGDQGIQGPAGPKGDQGIQGIEGPQGQPGVQGPEGPQGIPGTNSVAGITFKGTFDPAVTYVQGDTVVGPDNHVYVTDVTTATAAPPDAPWVLIAMSGATGPQGAQGVQGNPGPVGPAGPQGPQGQPGPAGAAGAKGDKGDTGAAGAKGDAGPKGDKGDTGATGPAGAQGPAGAKGDTGDKGEQGIPGLASNAINVSKPKVAGVIGPRRSYGSGYLYTVENPLKVPGFFTVAKGSASTAYWVYNYLVNHGEPDSSMIGAVSYTGNITTSMSTTVVPINPGQDVLLYTNYTSAATLHCDFFEGAGYELSDERVIGTYKGKVLYSKIAEYTMPNTLNVWQDMGELPGKILQATWSILRADGTSKWNYRDVGVAQYANKHFVLRTEYDGDRNQTFRLEFSYTKD